MSKFKTYAAVSGIRFQLMVGNEELRKYLKTEGTQDGVERHSFTDLETRLNSVAATAYEPPLYC